MNTQVLQVLCLRDDTLALYDAKSGIYTLRFDAARPAPAPPVWRVA